MSSEVKTMFEYLHCEATLDIDAVVEEAFSGEIGFVGLPACISDTATLRFLLMLGGQSPAPIDALLRQALSKQLEIGQRFARLWTQGNPDLDELVAVWQEQTEAIDRWQVLQSLLQDKKQLSEIEEAYGFALERYPYQMLRFNDEQERVAWCRALQNQQQRFVVLNQLAQAAIPPTECRLEGMALMVQGVSHPLQPAQASLLGALWDELPHSASTLLREAHGTKVAASDKVKNLSKRITDLNKRLDQIWGKPTGNGSRWICQSPHPTETAYRLFKFSGTLRN